MATVWLYVTACLSAELTPHIGVYMHASTCIADCLQVSAYPCISLRQLQFPCRTEGGLCRISAIDRMPRLLLETSFLFRPSSSSSLFLSFFFLFFRALSKPLHPTSFSFSRPVFLFVSFFPLALFFFLFCSFQKTTADWSSSS